MLKTTANDTEKEAPSSPQSSLRQNKNFSPALLGIHIRKVGFFLKKKVVLEKLISYLIQNVELF